MVFFSYKIKMIAFKWMVERETGDSLGRNKTAQFSLTECLSNYLTQWKRSQNITAKLSLKQDVQQRWDMTWCLGTPRSPHGLWPVGSGENRTADGRPDQRRGRESREEVVMGHWGKAVPRSTKMGPDASGGMRVFEPLQEVGSWAGCWWKPQPLSNDQLHFTVSVSINRQWCKANSTVLCTQDFI